MASPCPAPSPLAVRGLEVDAHDLALVDMNLIGYVLPRAFGELDDDVGLPELSTGAGGGLCAAAGKLLFVETHDVAGEIPQLVRLQDVTKRRHRRAVVAGRDGQCDIAQRVAASNSAAL